MTHLAKYSTLCRETGYWRNHPRRQRLRGTPCAPVRSFYPRTMFLSKQCHQGSCGFLGHFSRVLSPRKGGILRLWIKLYVFMMMCLISMLTIFVPIWKHEYSAVDNDWLILFLLLGCLRQHLSFLSTVILINIELFQLSWSTNHCIFLSIKASASNMQGRIWLDENIFWFVKTVHSTGWNETGFPELLKLLRRWFQYFWLAEINKMAVRKQ